MNVIYKIIINTFVLLLLEMKLTTLFEKNDIFLEIGTYLDFQDKIGLSHAVNKNCLLKYNFNGKSFRNKNIDDIFTFYDEHCNDEVSDYICELSSEFVSELDLYYDEYYAIQPMDYANNYYNNLSYEKYRELSELFHSSFLAIYARFMAEYIEKNNLSVAYYKYNLIELEEKVELFGTVIDYYKDVFEVGNIDIFCEKCGKFGHYNGHKECVFYNEGCANKIIAREVGWAINSIIDKIIDNDYKEKCKPLLCVGCGLNKKNKKCEYNSCGKCCSGCEIHKKE